MNDTHLLETIRAVGIQLPLFIISLVGIVMTISRWKDMPEAAIWSLLGFGLSAFLCLAIPVTQVAMQNYIAHNPENRVASMQAFGAVSIVWSLLRAGSYGVLLGAVFAGRQRNL